MAGIRVVESGIQLVWRDENSKVHSKYYGFGRQLLRKKEAYAEALSFKRILDVAHPRKKRAPESFAKTTNKRAEGRQLGIRLKVKKQGNSILCYITSQVTLSGKVHTKQVSIADHGVAQALREAIGHRTSLGLSCEPFEKLYPIYYSLYCEALRSEHATMYRP